MSRFCACFKGPPVNRTADMLAKACAFDDFKACHALALLLQNGKGDLRKNVMSVLSIGAGHLCGVLGARALAERRSLRERTVRPVRIVVLDVLAQDSLQVLARDDQQPVETLAANASQPPLGVRLRLWRRDRRQHHLHAVRPEDLVEAGGELTVAVADQKAQRCCSSSVMIDCALAARPRRRSGWQ